MSRRRTAQNYSRPLKLFHADTRKGWKVIARISYADGIARVKMGTFRRVFSVDKKLIGFQHLPASEGSVTLPAKLSACCITVAECEANAGTAFRGGKSRTAGMGDARRKARVCARTGKQLPAVDFVEAAQAKVRAWARLSVQDRVVTA